MATETDRGSPARAILSATGIGVAGLAAGTLLTLIVIVAIRSVTDIGISALIVLSLLLTQGVGMGGTALAYVTWRGVGVEYVSVRLPDLREVVWIVGSYVAAIVGIWVIGLLVTALNAPTAENQVAEIAIENPEVLLLLIPGSFLLIGPGEELLFRGIVQGRIREAIGPAPGILIASVVFAAIHFVALTGGVSGRLVTMGILLVPSLILGTAYEYTDNLVVPAVIHGAYNATLFAILYVVLEFGSGLEQSSMGLLV